MRKHGGPPSRRDKHVTLAAISPPGVARGRFVGGQQSGLAGCKPPPLFTRGASSCSSQGRRQGEPWGASPRPSAPTYLPGEAPHGQVVRTSFIHFNLHFRAGERAPAGPPFSGGQMRTCGSSIFGRANAHLRILHFWAGERAPADPPFPGRRTCSCGLSIFGRANAHLQILHFRAVKAHLRIPDFRAGKRTPGSPPFFGG